MNVSKRYSDCNIKIQRDQSTLVPGMSYFSAIVTNEKQQGFTFIPYVMKLRYPTTTMENYEKGEYTLGWFTLSCEFLRDVSAEDPN